MQTALKALPFVLKLVALIAACWAAGNWQLWQTQGGEVTLLNLIAVFAPGTVAVTSMATASVMDHKRVTQALHAEPPLPADKVSNARESVKRLASHFAGEADGPGLDLVKPLAVYLGGTK